MIMLPKIDLTNKCGSCCYFKAIGGTTQGECLQNPYGEDVVHDPEHPYWIVQRSRIKCRLYNTKPQTNADRIRAMSDEEIAKIFTSAVADGCPPKMDWDCAKDEYGWDACDACWCKWLKQPAEGE